MKRISIFLMTLILVFGLVFSSHAELINRGGGMIYSTDLDITWLQDANYARTSGYHADGLMTWDEAMTWTANLIHGDYDDWRLPNFDPDNPGNFDNPTLLHEMAYLNYVELGNPTIGGLDNTGPFINLLPDEHNYIEPWYWSRTEGTINPVNTAWRFDFTCG